MALPVFFKKLMYKQLNDLTFACKTNIALFLCEPQKRCGCRANRRRDGCFVDYAGAPLLCDEVRWESDIKSSSEKIFRAHLPPDWPDTNDIVCSDVMITSSKSRILMTCAVDTSSYGYSSAVNQRYIQYDSK